MAEAGEGCGGAGSLEAELTCPICLGLYREPVSLSCGHDFCRECLEKVLNSPHLWTCPTCRVRLEPTLELQKNLKLSSIVEAFQASKGQQAGGESLQREEGGEEEEEEEEEETGAVRCDHCLCGSRPAVKTCLVCEASLCQAHLGKHNAKSFHQDHILVEVGAGEQEERRCRDHGKLLECYCPREDKCICVLCSISRAHRGHGAITMKEEHGRQLAQLSNTMTELKKSRTDLMSALEKLHERENQTMSNTATVTFQLEELFQNIETELEKTKSEMLNDIRSREVKELAVIANVRKELECKRNQTEQNLQALQKIKEQPDLFLFFKDLKLVKSRIASLGLGTECVVMKKLQNRGIFTSHKPQKSKLQVQLSYLLQNMSDNLRRASEPQQESCKKSSLYKDCEYLGLLE